MNITIEKLWKEHLVKDLPFVVYKKSNSSQLIGLFQQNDQLFTVNTFKEEGFVMAPFYEGNRFYIPASESVEIVEPFIVNSAVIEGNIKFDYTNTAKKDFESLVQRCVEAINENTFEKVVPSRKEIVSKPSIDIIELFNRLVNTYSEAFCYVIYHPKVGLWAGATPETLLVVENKKVSTMALAGTQLNHGKDNVEWGQKEQEEQQFVTDFIVNQLEPYVTDCKVSEPYTKRAAKVMHICTDVEATLQVQTIQPIIEALHPTPAVCGMPKAAAREFLLKEEGYDRKYYSGYLGELNKTKERRTELFVNLRCMEIETNQLNLYIGCGVTKESKPESEFIETVNKATTMKKILY